MSFKSMVLRVERLTATAQLPAYAHPGDAGMDLCADEARVLQPGERAAVSTGIRIALPQGTEGQVRPRSGLSIKHGITVINAPGTIDEGYRGEGKVLLVNLGQEAFEITPGMRIAQLVVAPVLRVPVMEDVVDDTTVRGTGGFGSTGI
jgi:dUTP pyrophosphatase